MAQHSWLPMGSTWTTHDTLTGWKRILENLISTINNNITTVEGDIYEIQTGTTIITAAMVSVADSSSHYTGANVEDCLAEIATGLGGNEIIEYIGNCTYVSTGVNINFNFTYSNKPCYFVYPECNASVLTDTTGHYNGVNIAMNGGSSDTVYNFMAICSGKVTT